MGAWRSEILELGSVPGFVAFDLPGRRGPVPDRPDMGTTEEDFAPRREDPEGLASTR
jgi:hypothetical protein